MWCEGSAGVYVVILCASGVLWCLIDEPPFVID